jgi:hypothetical protein
MQLSRMLELLSSDVVVSYSSFAPLLARSGLVSHATRTTVRIAPSAPGEIAEIDFGRLGTLMHAESRVRPPSPDPTPWSRLAERYSIPRAEQACAYALSFELINVRRLEHILEDALDQPAATAADVEAVVDRLPPRSRVARPGSAFDQRVTVAAGVRS